MAADDGKLRLLGKTLEELRGDGKLRILGKTLEEMRENRPLYLCVLLLLLPFVLLFL